MTVGFYHVTPPWGYAPEAVSRAAAMVASVRKVMPGVEVVQFTDDRSERLKVDRVLERPHQPIALGCLEAYAQVQGDWLFLDTDTCVTQDVRHVFDGAFDVAVATRAGTLSKREQGSKFMARMPFNKGAVYSRSRAFWEHAHSRCLAMKPGAQAWMGDQLAMNQVIASGQFLVLVLPNSYNYAPAHGRDVVDKHVLHFKGPRKAWGVAV